MEGSQFVQRYHVQAFPHISMIDPRTGRLLWKREGWTQENPMTAQAFAELAMDFCSRNSLDKPPQAPKPPSQQQSQSQSQSQSQHQQSLPSDPDAMTEEEQLEAAVQASMMQQQPNSTDGNDDDDDDDEVQFVGHSAAEARAATSPVAPTAAAATPTATTAAAAAPTPALSWMQDLWNVEVTPESTTDGSTARLSFRMPNGSRVVRSFSPSDTVQMVYAFVAVRTYFCLLVFASGICVSHKNVFLCVVFVSFRVTMYMIDVLWRYSNRSGMVTRRTSWYRNNLPSRWDFHLAIWRRKWNKPFKRPPCMEKPSRYDGCK